jgi:hypothetical protein
MLTLSKIRTYERFRGDGDGFSRASGHDNSGITDEDWQLISRLSQAIYLVATNRASDGFRAQTEQQLLENTADEQAREAMRKLARSGY